MRCADPQCGFEGFQPNGLCPQCGKKLLPSVVLYESKVKPEKWSSRFRFFLLNLVFRFLETALFCATFYIAVYVFLMLYNMLCEEIEEWTPIEFYSPTVFLGLGLGSLLILFFNFKYRWRRK